MGWQEENLHVMLACKTTIEVFEILRKETSRLGLEYVAWGIQLPIPILDQRVITMNTYSRAWQDRYAEQGYLAIDPTIHHGMTSVLPTLWSSPALQTTPDFWEDAQAYGLREGIAQSVWDRCGCGSMLSLSRSGLEFTQTELVEKMPKISWLAQLAHTGMARLIVPREVPESAADLSTREKEVLKLAAAGMTSTDISERLHLTKRTIDFHFTNAISKLAADNRTDAVIRATVLGLV